MRKLLIVILRVFNISGPFVSLKPTYSLVHESGLFLGLGCGFLIIFLLKICVLLVHRVLAKLGSSVHFSRAYVDESVEIVFLKEAFCFISDCKGSWHLIHSSINRDAGAKAPATIVLDFLREIRLADVYHFLILKVWKPGFVTQNWKNSFFVDWVVHFWIEIICVDGVKLCCCCLFETINAFKLRGHLSLVLRRSLSSQSIFFGLVYRINVRHTSCDKIAPY